MNLSEALNFPWNREDYEFWFEKETDGQALFQEHLSIWYVSVYLCLAYLVIVYALRAFMASRPPLDLRSFLIPWNGLNALVSMLAVWRMWPAMFFTVYEVGLWKSCNAIIPPNNARFMAFWVSVWGYCKVIELGDTVLLVLRKRPLTFLHVFHHAGTLVLSWYAGCFLEIAVMNSWFVTMNFFVHSFMYTYFFVSALGFRMPRALSMSLTTLQMTQLILPMLLLAESIRSKTQMFRGALDDHRVLEVMLCGYAGNFAFFASYFYTAYIKEQKPKTKSQ